jgi:RHS repeat-associated protein
MKIKSTFFRLVLICCATFCSAAEARYFDAVTSRFMSVDPVGFKEQNLHSFNRYAYANNNPYRFIDPDGRDAVDVATGAYDWIVGMPGRIMDRWENPSHRLPNGPENAIAAGLGILGGMSAGAGLKSEAAKGVPTSPHIDPKDIAGKTPAQIDQLAKSNGLAPKGPDPMSGKGAYVDPITGNQRVLCHTNCASPHAHVNNPLGQRLDINGTVVPAESPQAHLPITYP